MSKIFVDTNVWAYAVDASAGEKRTNARKSLNRLGTQLSGVLSTQVLQEFYVTATRKLGIASLDAKQMLEDISINEVVIVDVELVMKATEISLRHELSFWDALIVTAADKAKCAELWTEDFNHGQRICGVRIVNPFK